MGAAVKHMRGGKRRAHRATPPSLRPPESPIDRAKGHELNWANVTPVFDLARGIENPEFVYIVSEGDGGPLKIGRAKDPVKRLRTMQTGNSRRLRIEFVLLGGQLLERLLHEIWEPHAVRAADRVNKIVTGPGTEWFKTEIRNELLDIMPFAVEDQIAYLTEEAQPHYAGLASVVYHAHVMYGANIHERDEVRLLGAVVGTATRNTSLVKFFRDPEIYRST